jgi:hypothetical protein
VNPEEELILDARSGQHDVERQRHCDMNEMATEPSLRINGCASNGCE